LFVQTVCDRVDVPDRKSLLCVCELAEEFGALPVGLPGASEELGRVAAQKASGRLHLSMN